MWKVHYEGCIALLQMLLHFKLQGLICFVRASKIHETIFIQQCSYKFLRHKIDVLRFLIKKHL